MGSALEYRINTDGDLFRSDSFLNTDSLKNYLNDSSKSNDADNKNFEFVSSMVETMCQLRFKAEELCKNHSWMVKNKRGALPLSWEQISNVLSEDKKNPPQTVISSIAQREIHIIEHVLKNARKVLKRERQPVNISSVQQLDSQCLRWLTRQPGITPIQKAGNRQKLLAVVREESFNTLENRVLKAFLNNCVSAGVRYLRQYGDEFPDSERILAVKKLQILCKLALQSSIFSKVSSLKGMPVPNYVLLHDSHYSKIWQMYEALIRQVKLLEEAWKFRHFIFQDYLYLKLACFLYELAGRTVYFQSDIFMNYSCVEGHFIKDPFFSRVIQGKNGSVLELGAFGNFFHCVENNSIDMYIRKGEHGIVTFSFIYIPSDVSCKVEFPEKRNHVYLVRNEALLSIVPKRKDIISLKTPKHINNSINRNIMVIIENLENAYKHI